MLCCAPFSSMSVSECSVCVCRRRRCDCVVVRLCGAVFVCVFGVPLCRCVLLELLVLVWSLVYVCSMWSEVVAVSCRDPD